VVNALTLASALAVATFVPLLQPGDTIPPIPLVDQSGHPFSVAQLRGDAVVLSFIYTRCADRQMCPLVSSKFERLQQLIGTARVRLLEITLDPQFDTPRVLRTYGHAYGAQTNRWTLATGAPASIDELAARMGIATRWTRPGTLIHTEAAIVVDPEGRIVQTIDGNAWTPEQLLATARATVGSAPSPLTRAVLWLTAAIESCGGTRGALSAWQMLAILLLAIGAISIVFFRAFRGAR
jgi:cytochrome oxidase Cu insertion factor (SCO1/SenC/PrrC family)